MFRNKYFDDQEGEGLSRETSHPNFVNHFRADFYFDCSDEFAPFGNDTGADFLYNLEDWYRVPALKRNLVKWVIQYITGYGYGIDTERVLMVADPEGLRKIHEASPYFMDEMDQTILAAAFGQIKITGRIDRDMKELALTALCRQQVITDHGIGAPDEGQDSEPHTLSEVYRSYLVIMKQDLECYDN